MKKFHIYLNNEDFGIYEAESKADALDQVAKDAGYENWNAAVEMSSATADSVEIIEE